MKDIFGTKNEILLGINPCIYGLNYHDPSVVVFINGEVVFGIEEERCNRIKGSKGLFPSSAIKQSLIHCNLTWDDIDAIVIGYDPALWMDRLNLEILDIIQKCKNDTDINSICGSRLIDSIINTNIIDRYSFFRCQDNVRKLIIQKCSAPETIEVLFCEHHLAHIASSYESSGFYNAVGVVVDGIGESAVTTLWQINNHRYKKILQLDYPNSLGYFYAAATRFLGFEPWRDEGKTMALAAYGKMNEDISDRLKDYLTINGDFYDVSNLIRNHSAGFLMMNEEEIIGVLESLLGFSAREKNAPITKKHMDFAWFVQNYLERSIISLINYAIRTTGISNVCTAGGVFMNCKMNMIADFVVGDHWGADKMIDDDKGTSVVILSTTHSKPLFESMKHRIECVEIEYSDVIRSNPRMITSVPYNPDQEEFYSLLNTGSFSNAVNSIISNDEPLCDILTDIVLVTEKEEQQ